MFWISSGSVVMSPFSFLILLICLLCLSPSVSLVKGLSVFLVLSKTQFMVSILWNNLRSATSNYYLFFESQVEFCAKTIWLWAFFGWETFNDRFYFLRSYRTI